MDEFSKILLQLYEFELMSGEILLSNSFCLIKKFFPFQAAVWSKGSISDNKLIFHDCSFHNACPKIQKEWEVIKQSDCFSNSNNAHFTFINDEEENCGKIYHAKNFVVLIYPNKFNNVFELLGLYGENMFQSDISGSERYLCYLMPHLVSLYNKHQIHTMAKSTVAKRKNQFELAITNFNGMLDSSEIDFIKRIQCEWPNWKGPKLPPPLIEIITNNKQTNYHGTNIVIYCIQKDKYVYLFARGISEVDKLSTRELYIGKLFSVGKTYKEIAKHIDISPSTVRVHLHSIYGKLSINTKIQLINIIRQVDVGGIN